jgi:hypothetical protein
MPLWFQDDLREKLSLEGGDDRVRLAAIGLAVEEPDLWDGQL